MERKIGKRLFLSIFGCGFHIGISLSSINWEFISKWYILGTRDRYSIQNRYLIGFNKWWFVVILLFSSRLIIVVFVENPNFGHKLVISFYYSEFG